MTEVTLNFHIYKDCPKRLGPHSPIVVGCSLTFSCTPKDVKVHADDNGTIVFLTNPTSFIGII